MEQLWLPKTENRTITTGYHISLGTHMQEGILRSSPHNDKYAEIIKKVNHMIGEVTQGRFRWNAMEIYKNTILRPQVKLEHDGLTAQFLIGNFTGGLFRTTDSAVTLSTPGELILYHANVPH